MLRLRTRLRKFLNRFRHHPLSTPVELWLAALRSKDWNQTTNYLCVEGGDKPGFCCLGVLCELYQTEVGGLKVDRKETETSIKNPHGKKFTVVSYNGAAGGLPEEVQAWAGLQTASGQYDGGSLISCNDTKKMSFPEIADLIESRPTGLFV